MRARRHLPLAFGLAAILTIAAVGATSAGGRPLSTDLSWTEEVNAAGVPNQGEPNATGHARITLNPGTGEVCWDITVSGLTSLVTRSHIHNAAAGSNGGIVIDFFNNLAGIPGTEFTGCTQSSRTLILDVFHNPSNYYVNVHSIARPGGAVRGQLGD
jgi:hypothetical protein